MLRGLASVGRRPPVPYVVFDVLIEDIDVLIEDIGKLIDILVSMGVVVVELLF